MVLSRSRACCSLALLTLNARRCFVSAFICDSTPKASAVWNQEYYQQQRLFSSSPLAMTTEKAEINVGAHIEEVRQKIVQACENAGRDEREVRLVAVSKTKPLELVKQAYASGQRVFGENYAQELVEKAGEFVETDVQWHFIGSLQSNKANMLVKGVVPYGKLVVETVSSLKLAKKLDSAMSDFEGKLGIFVQVNTSGEDSKSGVNPEEAVELCQQITKECERLHLQGVMTIGAPGDTECLDSLVECRDKVAKALDMSPKDLEVSMGMSGDYETAIQKGSTNVRVGSTIFGARDYSNKT
jgi:pyridoxal phosphate enzyme (YggS family)